MEIEATVDLDDASAVEAASVRMQGLVHKAGASGTLRLAIADAYEKLGAGRVAVRSSATAEDTAGTSFAGMNRTFTNVEGADAVVDRVVDCWASLFGSDVVAYRRTCEHRRRARDRRRGAADGRLRPQWRDVHRRPVDRTIATAS